MNSISIVKTLDVLKESQVGLLEGFVELEVDLLLLERGMKRLHRCVIKGTALLAEGRSAAQSMNESTVLSAGVLRATVAVYHFWGSLSS